MSRSFFLRSPVGAAVRPDAGEWLAMVDDPAFRALVQAKRRFLLGCWALVATSYFSLSVGVALAPAWFAVPLIGEANRGLVLALGEVGLVLVVAALYVRRANRDFDRRAAALAKVFSAARRR